MTVDIYINSELYAGSEVYGLLIAKNLAELGIRTRIRIPERNVYGGDPAALDAWLARHGLTSTVRTPILPSIRHSILRPEAEREDAVSRLQAFISATADLLLATGHNPQLADVRHRPPLFMAFFSLAAYEQTWLADLQGQLHGIISDNEWALRPTAAVVGAPGRVIPSPVEGVGGAEIERVTGDPPRWPVRVVVAGTIVPRKRQLEAVKAVGLLRRRGYEVELHLYGLLIDGMKDYGALVDQEIGKQDLTSHVVKHGFVEDGSEITRDNDVVLCCSTDESLPQGLIFQMYEGLIGVAVLSGGIDEYVIDCETGYLTRTIRARRGWPMPWRGRWMIDPTGAKSPKRRGSLHPGTLRRRTGHRRTAGPLRRRARVVRLGDIGRRTRRPEPQRGPPRPRRQFKHSPKWWNPRKRENRIEPPLSGRQPRCGTLSARTRESQRQARPTTSPTSVS